MIRLKSTVLFVSSKISKRAVFRCMKERSTAWKQRRCDLRDTCLILSFSVALDIYMQEKIFVIFLICCVCSMAFHLSLVNKGVQKRFA